MQKYDSQVEGVCRRIERSMQEVEASSGNPMTSTKIITNTQTVPFSQYLSTWSWDEAKYPKARGLQNTLTLLLSVVNKLDEEARTKSSQFNEVKTAQTNAQKKQQGSLMSKDMIDVLTPSVVGPNDMVYTEHLTTLVMILPQTSVEPFLKTYHTYAEKVVPLSAKQFPSIVEEDGTSLWRVVVFKESIDAFMKKVREERIGTCRQFEYSEAAYSKLQAARAEMATECEKQEKIMKGFCKAALSDAMVAWVHLKAMRVFLESTLRFGVPPKFAAFLMAPKDNMAPKARKALEMVMGSGAQSAGISDKKEGEDEEDYFPYVSVTFTPFAVAKGF
jgi:V-type H+-transporting ATPase subunit C